MSSLTVLRIQRHSTADPPPDTLRLPHIDEDTSYRAAVFRRFSLDGFATSAPTDRKRKVQLVDAQLGDDNERSNKRTKRSLRVLCTQTISSQQLCQLTAPIASRQQMEPTNSSASSLRQRMKERARSNANAHQAAIWDPLLRQVDHSLVQLFNAVESETSEDNFLQHLQLILTNIPNTSKSLAEYLNWPCSNGQGTFLHALVQNNAIETLLYYVSTYGPYHIDFTATNRIGQTPEQLSNALSDTRIYDIFDAYTTLQLDRNLDSGAITTATMTTHSKEVLTEYDYYIDRKSVV